MSITLPAQPKILIVLLGSIGDVARALFLYAELREQLPQAEITWLVEPKSEGLVRLVDGLKRVLVFERQRGIAGMLKLWRELRAQHFDLTLDLQRHLKSGIFSWLSGSRYRVGFHRRDAKEFNWLFNNRHISEKGDQVSKVEHYLEFLTALDLSFQETRLPKLNVPQLDPALTNGWSAGPGYVAMVLGSSWQSKDWPIGGYSDLVKIVLDHSNLGVALVGDRSQAARGDELIKHLASERVVNLAGKSSLAQAVALLKAARVVVGPDSGPGHICAALGVPYVGLFGPTAISRCAPWGSEELALKAAVACAPCGRRVCPGLGGVCMRLISAEAVGAKLERFLQ